MRIDACTWVFRTAVVLAAFLAVGCGGGESTGENGNGADVDAGPEAVEGDGIIWADGTGPGDSDNRGEGSWGEGTRTDGFEVVELVPCEDGTGCESGFCIPGPDGKVCAPLCVEDCPKGWACAQIQNDPDVTWICIWPHGNLCRPCMDDAVCNDEGAFSSNICLSKGAEGSYCGAQCDDNDACPAGFSCNEVASGPDGAIKQCVSLEPCECNAQAIAESAETECFVGNGVGACKGTRGCSEEGLTECSATLPGQETCDEVDNDCDGQTDETGAQGCAQLFVDGDEDGFGDQPGQCYCKKEPGVSDVQGDCDDSKASTFPDAEEVCDGEDDDCDGATDEKDAFGCTDFLPDADGDGYGGPEGECVCAGTPGYVTQAGDCDEGSALVSPEAEEVCNGIDDNCDGEVDPKDSGGCGIYYADLDGDGVGTSLAFSCLCDAEAPYTSTLPDDCDDYDPEISSGTAEACDGKDNDCDLEVDEADSSGCAPFFVDSDMDGFGAETVVCLCGQGPGYSQVSGDCDDTNAAANPNSAEVCNGWDDDCDGTADPPDVSGCMQHFPDVDLDLYGNGADPGLCLCAPEGTYTAYNTMDCDDSDAAVNPEGKEICDEVDNDCNGSVDDPGTDGCVQYFSDQDSDSYGALGTAGQCLCAPVGVFTSTNDLDCNDAADTINPLALEACNGVDDNCDGATDPALSVNCIPYYKDGDSDGFGALGSQGQCLCKPDPVFKALNNDDCNDSDAGVNPSGEEACDGKDNNCDSISDPEGSKWCKVYYPDEDSDTYGAVAGPTKCLCGPNGAWKVFDHQDCDDKNKDVKPGAPEKCDGLDNNCDGKTDPVGSPGCEMYYKDLDGDGAGSTTGQGQCQCAPASPFVVKTNNDCNDANPAIPSCTNKSCGDDGCGGSCGTCGAGYSCLAHSCEPTAMIRQSGTCPVGYTEAGKWFTSVNTADGKEDLRGFEQDPKDAVWASYCSLAPEKYFVNVFSDQCNGAHPYLGCPAGFATAGRFRVGKKQDNGPTCWQTSGEGYKNGTTQSGWMVMCKPTGLLGVELLVSELECDNPSTNPCPLWWTQVGEFHTVPGKCDGEAESFPGLGGNIDSGWTQLCANPK